MKNFFKNVKPSTIVRCVIYIMVLINQILAIFGTGLPFTSNLVYQILSAALTVGVGAWAAWKNNDFTKLACTAGKVFDALKDGKITEEEAKNLLESADAMITAESDDEDEEGIDEDEEEIAEKE